MNLLRPALLAFIVALAALPQPRPREVSGVVTDKAGNTLPKSVVELENTVTLQIQSYIADSDGRYLFKGLNPDVEFTVVARYRNTWSKKVTISKFNEKQHTVVNLVVPVE